MIDKPFPLGGPSHVGQDRSASLVSMIIRSVCFGLIFWAAALLSRSLSIKSSVYVPFWLPSAAYLAALLLNSVRTRPMYMAAALIANAFFDLTQGTPFATSLWFYTANTPGGKAPHDPLVARGEHTRPQYS